MYKILLLSIVVLSLNSCSKKEEFNYSEWKAGESAQLKYKLLALSDTINSSQTTYKEQRIKIMRQLYNGKPVVDTFLKSVEGQKGIEFLQARYVDPKTIQESTSKSKSISKDPLTSLKAYATKFSKIDVIKEEDSYLIRNQIAMPVKVISFFDYSGEPYQAIFDERGSVLEVKRVGSHFIDVTTQLYLEGPKLGPLTDVILKRLSAQPSISNEIVFVNSEAEKKVSQLSSVLKFEPEDERFDQMQAFFYLNKAMSWMRDNLQVRLPQRVDAVVAMGFPEKTNSAFYYQGKIRFGSGDGVVYSKIAQDPSIVSHEAFHALIDSVAALPFEGEGGSLNEAFADFFTCLMLNRSTLGDSSYLKGPFKRNINNNDRLEDKNGGLYHDSLIISGLLWETKEKIGAEKVKNLAVETLVKLNAASKFADFNNKFLEASNKLLSVEEVSLVKNILRSRGFRAE